MTEQEKILPDTPPPYSQMTGGKLPEIPAWKDQAAFEEWAKSEGYEMHQHPLHYLFLEAKTNAARMGWKAGIDFARAALTTEGQP